MISRGEVFIRVIDRTFPFMFMSLYVLVMTFVRNLERVELFIS